MNHIKLLFICLLFSGITHSQTIGLMLNSSEAYNGYTLYSSNQYTSTFLINNCGQVINEWESDHTPGLASYLSHDGSLVRAGVYRDGNSFIKAGTGGILQRIDWNGIVEWEILINNDTLGLHHDFHLMDNGNILAIGWERVDKDAAISAGREPELFDENELWSEVVLEIKPIGSDSFDIVWQWNLWDHLIQDFDIEKDNYGIVSERAELINVNYFSSLDKDWIHLNSIYFDEELDQIILSAREFNEIWIIDHSTTTVEASSHEGGNFESGGDIVFRWGNDSSFNFLETDSKLNKQHNAEFQSDGSILVYNNNSDIPLDSEIIRITPLFENGKYVFDNYYRLTKDPEYLLKEVASEFSSPILSSVETLPNGNILVNKGDNSEFREYNTDGDLVWFYKGTLSLFGPLEQGSFTTGQTFKILKYSVSDSRFDEVDTSIKFDQIESNPLPFDCEIFTSIGSIGFEEKDNVFYDINKKMIINDSSTAYDIFLFDSTGRLITNTILKMNSVLSLNEIGNGLYYLKGLNNRGDNFSFPVVVL